MVRFVKIKTFDRAEKVLTYTCVSTLQGCQAFTFSDPSYVYTYDLFLTDIYYICAYFKISSHNLVKQIHKLSLKCLTTN